MNPHLQRLCNAICALSHLGGGRDEKGKQEDSLRVATVLRNILNNDGLGEETKTRAKWWVAQAATEPSMRRMFHRATETAIESFLMLPEPEQKTLVAGQREPTLSPRRTIAVGVYSVVFALISAFMLIDYAAKSIPKESKGETRTLSSSEESKGETRTLSRSDLRTMLHTVMVAGFLGGILCNLSGLYTQLVDSKGDFPAYLELPFYIRPWTGLMTGLVAFCIGSFLAISAGGDPATNGWHNLAGRWPFIAIAIFAGFAAQDFVARVKQTVQTLFSTPSEQPNAAGAAPPGAPQPAASQPR